MSRVVIPVLLAACVVGAAAADEPKKDAVRQIEARDVKTSDDGTFDRPQEITNPKVLATVAASPDALAALLKQVDFTAEKLVLFRWAGSGGDRLAFAVEKGKEAPEVVFTFTPGKTDDLRRHVHLFVVPKAATFKVQTAKP